MMEDTLYSQVIECFAKVESWNDAQDNKAFAEFQFSGDGKLVIKINSVAAVELCMAIMKLVTDDINGKHQHFDKFNFVDEGNGELIVVYSK